MTSDKSISYQSKLFTIGCFDQLQTGTKFLCMSKATRIKPTYQLLITPSLKNYFEHHYPHLDIYFLFGLILHFMQSFQKKSIDL